MNPRPDITAVTGRPGVIRRFPMVCGIDFAGVVEESASPEFKSGDAVALTGASASGFGVDVDEGIEDWLGLLNAGEMGFDQFDGREFAAVEFFEGFGDGKIAGGRHVFLAR